MIIHGLKRKLQPEERASQQPEVKTKKAVKKVEPVTKPVVKPVLSEEEEDILLDEEVTTETEDLI